MTTSVLPRAPSQPSSVSVQRCARARQLIVDAGAAQFGDVAVTPRPDGVEVRLSRRRTMRQHFLTGLDVAERPGMLERERQLRVIEDVEDDHLHARGPAAGAARR